jgi:hypothetical protein
MRAVEAPQTAHATAEPGRDEDVALLASIAAGERSALTALYGRWRRSLFAFLLTQTSDRAVAGETLRVERRLSGAAMLTLDMSETSGDLRGWTSGGC